MSNTNPLARLFLSYTHSIADNLDRQAAAVECLYGIDLSDEEFAFLANTIKESDQQLLAIFNVLNELYQQYKLQYKTVDGFITDKLITQASSNYVDSLYDWSLKPVNPYKPNPDVLKNILDES